MLILPGFPVMLGSLGYKFIGAAVSSAGSSTDTNKNVTLSPHVNTAPGDILVAFAAGTGNGAWSIGIPAGWTNLRSTPLMYASVLCAGIRGSGDGGYSFSLIGFSLGVIILTFRRADVGGYPNNITSAGAGAVNLSQIVGAVAGSDMVAFTGLMSVDNSIPTVNSFPGQMEEIASVVSPSATGTRRTLVRAFVEKNLAGGNTGVRTFDFSHTSRSILVEIKKGS